MLHSFGMPDCLFYYSTQFWRDRYQYTCMFLRKVADVFYSCINNVTKTFFFNVFPLPILIFTGIPCNCKLKRIILNILKQMKVSFRQSWLWWIQANLRVWTNPTRMPCTQQPCHLMAHSKTYNSTTPDPRRFILRSRRRQLLQLQQISDQQLMPGLGVIRWPPLSIPGHFDLK